VAPEERARLTLYHWMQDTADEEKAEALMASLPPTHWPDLATKQDLETLKLATKQDLETLKLATKQNLETLKYELLAAFRGELTAAITAQTRTLTFQVVSLFVAFAGLTFLAR
jgi:hypothetical protein